MHRTTLRRGLVTAALLAAAVAPQAAAAQTLAGEQFSSAAHIEAVTYDGTCNPDGESTFTYYTWGSATGPVPGAMEETGTFTLASPSGPVTAFSASFMIHGNDGLTVEGTKMLAGTASGSCSVDSYGQPSFDAQIPATYTTTSPFSESGQSSVSVQGIGYSGTYGSTFGAAPSGPGSKEDCMNGGYAAYGFKNQGQCIAWVNHDG